MKKTVLLVLVASVFSVGLGAGYIVNKKRIFPHDFLESTYNFLKEQENKNTVDYGPWSIGIYGGDSPFDLRPADGVTNPVLTALDVTDVNATFVADPFLINHDEIFLMFFEVLNKDTGHGDIAYAESIDGNSWSYKKLIIDEDFHLSYPQVFNWNDEFYMIPESYSDLSVRIYKANSFPSDWEYITTILSGYPYIDPTILRYEKKWWLFVSTPSNNNLNVYFSKELDNGWMPHPMNPIVRNDKNRARPAGRILEYNGDLFRITQDDYPEYGTQVFGFKIVELSEHRYSEVKISDHAILSGSGEGWNGSGMHHLDALKIEGRWKAAVDGRDR